MNIKKNIAVWGVLLALLVALVPPSSARANTTETTADDVKYRDIEDFMHGMGYTSFIKKDGYFYIVTWNAMYSNSECFVLHEIKERAYDSYYSRDAYIALNSDDGLLYVLGCSYKSYHYYYYVPEVASVADIYNCVYTIITSNNRTDYGAEFIYTPTNCWIDGLKLFDSGIDDVVYSDLPVYGLSGIVAKDRFPDLSYDDVVYESNRYDNYSFPVWCADAGLNCLASSNESPTKIPYSYNSYWHIVRKTSSGKWLLTTVGNSVSQENASDYTFMYSEDMGTLKVLNLYSGEDTNGYLLNVRQYEYDTDGWKVRTYETYDARETDDCIIDLGAGSGVDDTRVLTYTNVNIYDQNFELVTSASTEYVEPTTPEVTPDPTTTPSGGESSGDSSEDGGSGDTNDRNPTPDRTETNVDLGVDLDDITLDEIPEVIKNIKDSVKEFFGLVGVVPMMIGAVFGFLPDWCLWVLGVSFAFVGILLVVKLLRG